MKRDTLALGRPQQPGLYTNFVDRYCLLTCTEVETLQNRIEQERNRVTQLQSGILAGDKSHKAELDAANAALKKLESQVSAKEKEIRDRQRNQLVPPAM
jgi:cob(I)alamin adenosyltransferase